MDTSLHALHSSPPEAEPAAADLPSWELDALTEWQVSAPMPASAPARPVDGDVTEALDASAPPKQGPAAVSRTPPPATPAPTQPITAETPRAAPAGTLPRRPGKGVGTGATAAAVRPLPTRLAPGVVLANRYVIEKQVAHYGVGHVYRALDRHREAAGAREPRVALKFARRSVGDAGETSSMLRQEFLKLSELRHPNIVDVFDIARDGDLEFIVMEWLSGETLADLLARITTRRIALDRAVDIVRSTARALAHAHEQGVVHGDVKPSNIFLAGARTVKVLDFGSSASSSPGERDQGERHWATRAYASCDVLEGRPPQPHDDVFALGVTAYHLLSGERPFGDLDAAEARARGLEPPPLPEDALDRWPAIRHALALDALDRTGNAGVFLREFDDLPAEPAGEAGTRTAFYGAVAATLLASLVWWSVDGIDGLPPPSLAALAAADRAFAEGRLVEPPDASALALYSRVLETEPDNPLALAGLENIAERFVAGAREAVLAGDVAGARASLALARRADPGHVGVALVEDLLVARGRAALLEAGEVARDDPGRAEALLAEAGAVLPANDPDLAAARDAIAARRAENRLEELLEAIDERILAERLTVPTGDSALDLLRRARELKPDDPRLPLAADRIMTALLFQAMFAISDGDLPRAEEYLSMARGMHVRHLALARAEYELARARRAALADR